ncbi:MAG: aminoacyl-histidine dipeptidase [Bacteroidales bacterium]|nr:aminoacyl-histidine dipeptidase [Bacteroidales bacterium]
MTIKDLTPKNVWNNFYLLTQQPRPSKHEEKVREFLLKWAKEKGVNAWADETGNVIMRKPATPGFENRKGVVLQAHMDMVPQKIASSKHDFLNDPIETVIDGDWVKANGTTLGADDGLGVAFAMSIMESKDLKHGPIDVLITYDEETGMTGAENLKPGVLKGDILLNLDSEDDDELCIGCAGGLDAIATFKYKNVRVPAGYKTYCINISGLQGGHSGMDISLYRGNANQIAAAAIIPVMEKKGVKLVKFTGGSLRNAIPFEAEVIIAVPAEKEIAVVRALNKNLSNAKARYKESDPDFKYKVGKAPKAAIWCIQEDVALNAAKSIIMCPSNVIRMSQSMPGLTETSINLAIVRCEKGTIKVASLMRSAINESKEELAKRLRYIFEAAGARIRFEGGYCGWVPKPDSPLISLINGIYHKLYGEDMKVRATHGGLECALLGAKYPHWDMVSIGSTVRYPHSPDERCLIASVQKTWDLVCEILVNIPEK